jgi:hypothetical protein
MNMSGRTSVTCTQMIQELALDPYYGQRLLKDESGEREDPDSEIPLLIRKGLVNQAKNITGERLERQDWSAKAVFFEIRSEYVEPILKSIYEGHPSKQYFETAFNLLPCKSDRLRFLVYTWCGPLGLPYTRDGHSIENQEIDILKNWSKEFEIKLEDLKVFLRNNNWPLPVRIFGGEPDNTQKKVDLTDQQFQLSYDLKVVLLTKIQKELQELNNIQSASIDELERKTKKVDQHETRIQAIVDLEITEDSVIKSNSRRAERSIETQARYLRWNRQYLAKKQKHPDKSDVWISQQIAREQDGEVVPPSTIRRRMKL